MHVMKFAEELIGELSSLPGVKNCRLYGSLSTGTWDQYSDIDIQLDVSGCDNGQFILELPKLLSERYGLVFYDYAPSLAPGKYVVSLALDGAHPFRMVDIGCTAEPHCPSVSREELSGLNNRYDHLLKLFIANLKHHIRKADCHADILRMYRKVFEECSGLSDHQMLEEVFGWLDRKALPKYRPLIKALREHL
ncbi:MAG: nucleotidyltransferase domain-containing protein [Oscillospiraceae bacterium]|nr:nucleotidyltransferase domain-containing protein [Oscillospiraceae bacterium]